MYTSLAAVSETMRQMILDSMTSDVGPSGLATFFTGMTTASLETPQQMTSAGKQGVSVWLYRVVRDENRLNSPPTLRPAGGGRIEVIPPPLPLRLHYLMTPIAKGQPDTEQKILGRVLQLFHTHPIIAGSFLRGELTGSDIEIHTRLEALSLDEITRVWEALEGSYQLSVSYEVSLANIDSDVLPVSGSLVESVHPDLALIVGEGA